MKIRFKLVIQYMVITVVILSSVFTFVYHITIENMDENYYNLLDNRVLVLAQKDFEKDELSEKAYNKILDNYKKIFSETTEYVFSINDTQELSQHLNKNQLEELSRTRKIRFKKNGLHCVALYYQDNQGTYILMITSKDVQGEYIKSKLLMTLIILLVFCCALVFTFSWWNATLIKIPLQMMVAKTQEISANNLHLRLKERKGKDEIAELINLFNLMLERLDVSFNSQKAFISNASHELNNPLTAIMGECEVMQLKQHSYEEYQDALKRIEEESQRLSKLVGSLLRLTQTDLNLSQSTLQEINISKETKNVVDYLNGKFDNRINLINCTLNNSHLIKCNEELLFVALQNIIKNACKYSEHEVFVKLENSDTEFSINIIDRGIGIPDSELTKIFEAFYRAKNTYQFKGHGIGLSLADKIIKQTGGQIKVHSIENKGTTMSIIWKK